MSLMVCKWKIILLIDGINWFWSIAASVAAVFVVRLIHQRANRNTTGVRFPECVCLDRVFEMVPSVRQIDTKQAN